MIVPIKNNYGVGMTMWAFGVAADRSGRAFRYKSSLRSGLFTAIPNAGCLNQNLQNLRMSRME